MQKIFRSTEKNYTRNALVVAIILMTGALTTTGVFIYLAYSEKLPQAYFLAALTLFTLLFDFYPVYLIRNGRRDYAVMLLLTSVISNILVPVFILRGVGVVSALAVLLITLTVVGQAMPPRYAISGVSVAVVFSALVFTLDRLLSPNRITVPNLELYMPYVIGLITVPLLFGFIRSFNNFSLQAKITVGILITGGITVATLLWYGVSRVNLIRASLTDRYQASVQEKTEAKILDVTNAEANNIDDLFLEAQNDILSLASYRSRIEKQKLQTDEGVYWNAAERLVQYSSGQYGNANTELASIYVPNTYTLNDEMISDINTSIYLDFLVPGFIEAHPESVAVYYISKLGYTIYYPNISLAENVPPDFDPTTQPFYTIATPANDPERSPKWTRPYQDPAGTGLIVTVAAPVYDGNTFLGVAATDIQLAQIAEAVSQINVSETGIPLLVDQNGLIIAMSEAGYSYFGLEPEVVPVNESPTQTIFNGTANDIQEVALQIFGSQSGLSTFNVNGTDTYLSVAVLGTTGYKLAFIAPVSELNSEVIALRRDVDAEITNTLQNVSLILALLFVGAFFSSLLVGQIITRPLKRLTETAEDIAKGNFASRARVESMDESGLLAQSFNTMADKLTDSLQGLEDRIKERTGALENLSKTNAYRATRFEAIARISKIISSTRSIEQLLPQIAETISSQLGYYHVGIFLVDVHRDFAVLMAANSEGGKKMLGRGHRLRVGATGIVGNVTQTGLPRVALDVGQDAIFFNNPDLPDTHSEIALPLRSGADIIGALDVQSKLPNAFSDEDVNILSALADQVSIAIQNARSFQQSVESLEKAERAAAQLSEQQWRYFTQQARTGFHFDGVNIQPSGAEDKAQTNKLSIPIILRGTQIGTLKLSTTDPDHEWDSNEIAMAEATAERTALAIEAARLLEDAQKRAAKERTIGEISSKIGNLVNIDNIVQTTIQELGSLLTGTDVAIQFTTGQTRQDT